MRDGVLVFKWLVWDNKEGHWEMGSVLKYMITLRSRQISYTGQGSGNVGLN
jgi:hypothetical protein